MRTDTKTYFSVVDLCVTESYQGGLRPRWKAFLLEAHHGAAHPVWVDK